MNMWKTPGQVLAREDQTAALHRKHEDNVGHLHASSSAARERRRTLRRGRTKVGVALHLTAHLTFWSPSSHCFSLLCRKLVAQKQEEML